MKTQFPGLRKPLGWALAAFTTFLSMSLATIDYLGYDVTKLPQFEEKQTTSLVIREMNPEDITVIEDLIQIIPHMMLDDVSFATQKNLSNQYNLDFPYDTPKDQTLAYFTSDKMKVWVCEVADQVVGFISYPLELVKNPVNQENQGFVALIGVSQPFQRRGIGSKLLNKATQYFKDLDADTLNLTVQDTNTEAIKFYESLGFKKVMAMPGVGAAYALRLK